MAGVGRQLEAAAEIRRAEEIDPISLPVNAAAGTILYYARQYPEALEQFKKTLELDPNFAPADIGLGRVYRELGMTEEALAELETGALFHRRQSSLAALGSAYGLLGYNDQALKILAEMEDQSSQKYVEPVSLGMVYLGLHNYDQRFGGCDGQWNVRRILSVPSKLRQNSTRSAPIHVSATCCGAPTWHREETATRNRNGSG